MPHIEKFVGSSHFSKPSILSMDINQYRSLLSLLEHSYRIAFDFDSRPGLKFLIQKISRSEVPSNLYQISSLVWSVQFMTNFYISSDEKLRNTEYREALKQLLTDLCDKYTECVQSSDANDTTIDDICHQSLFFLQATNDELADIIGRDKVIKDNCEESPDNKDTENNLNAVNDENSCNPNNEDDIKIYRLATEKKIDSLMAQYKRFKTQHSPIPPTVTETQVTKVTKKKSLEKKTSNDRQLMGAEKDNEKLIIKDGQAFIALWSEVIASAIELHLSLPINQFNYLIPAFIPSIQTLIIYSNSKQLRTCIALWMSKIADHIIDKLE